MNEAIQKQLDKNYKNVAKKDVQTQEAFQKQSDKFEALKKANATTVKNEMKDLLQSEKEVKNTEKAELKTIKETNKDQLAAVKVKQDETNKKYDELELKSQSKLQKELERLATQKEKLNAAYQKLSENVESQYNKDVEANQKEQQRIEQEGQKTQEKLATEFAEKQAKHVEKIAQIEEKRDALIAKLNEQTEKKIAKLEEGVVKQREKVDKQLADQVPIFEEKLKEIEELIAREQNEFETKRKDINDTLNSKVERRNKFLEKAENENDAKAAKIQRKEIKQLEQAADREIKALEKTHTDRQTDLSVKKKELLKNNLEQIAAIEREFVNFKEDNLMQIELNKVTLNDEITKAKLDTELKLLDEKAKFNEYTQKLNDEQAKEQKETELKQIEQRDLLQKLLIAFNKTNADNLHQLEEDIALNQKEVQIAELQKLNESANIECDRNIALAKLESDKEIANHQCDFDTIKSQKQSLIKQFKLDSDRLASVKSEFTSNQEGLAAKLQERAEKLLELEETEILNRINLKVAQLNEQVSFIEDDYLQIASTIELALNQELDQYNKEIEKIAAEDQKALQDYKTETETLIQSLVEEKKELDPKADKDKILALDKEIEKKRKAFTLEYKQKEDFIFAKTQVFQANIELAKQRKNEALAEVKTVSDQEKQELQAALDFVHKQKELELAEAAKRCDHTVQNAQNYKNLVTNRNQKTTEQNNVYLQNRVNKEESAINDTLKRFEQHRNQSTNELEANVLKQEDLRDKANNELKSNANLRESELEAKLSEIKQKRQRQAAIEQTDLQEQASKRSSETAQVEKVYNDSVRAHAKKQQELQAKYEADVQDIDKKQVVEKKQFEAEQSRVQKEYDIELKKGLLAIKTKLDTDIKAL